MRPPGGRTQRDSSPRRKNATAGAKAGGLGKACRGSGEESTQLTSRSSARSSLRKCHWPGSPSSGGERTSTTAGASRGPCTTRSGLAAPTRPSHPAAARRSQQDEGNTGNGSLASSSADLRVGNLLRQPSPTVRPEARKGGPWPHFSVIRSIAGYSDRGVRKDRKTAAPATVKPATEGARSGLCVTPPLFFYVEPRSVWSTSSPSSMRKNPSAGTS
jgi:hypothetical protein